MRGNLGDHDVLLTDSSKSLFIRALNLALQVGRCLLHGLLRSHRPVCGTVKSTLQGKPNLTPPSNLHNNRIEKLLGSFRKVSSLLMLFISSAAAAAAEDELEVNRRRGQEADRPAAWGVSEMDALVADFGEPSFEVFDLGAGDGLDDAEEGPPRRGSRREIRRSKSEIRKGGAPLPGPLPWRRGRRRQVCRVWSR